MLDSSPLAKHTHDDHASNQAESSQEGDDGAGVKQLCVPVHPVLGPHLYDTDPDKNTSGHRVESADGNDGAAVIAVEMLQHANANGHADGGDERKGGGDDELLDQGESQSLERVEAVGGGGGLFDFDSGRAIVLLHGRGGAELGNASTESDTFEHLVEENDDEEGEEEGVTGDDQGNAND